MASFESSPDYMIYHPEKAGCLDLFRLLLFKRRISDLKFIESSHSQGTKLELENAKANIIIFFTIIIQKFLLLIEVPLRLFGFFLEFSFNLVSINGGIFGLIFRVITCKLEIPKQDSEKYRSFIGHIDGRLDLYKTSSFLSYLPQMGTLNTANDVKLLDLCMLASKVVYENEAYVKNAVINHWKMHFVGFYNCWNMFLKKKDTQAFIFCDRPEDARVIYVAFRGTEPFNARDWVTDVDLSFISMGKMGKAHLGFMKAMGLQDEKNYLNGWPKDYQGEQNKAGAYYIVRDKLKELLQQHKNAKIVITGHSLGGALAAIFPSILTMHGETTILNSLVGLMTYGQPRVGDETFANSIEENINTSNEKWCYRVVYRYDVVPRVPLDIPILQFKHFGMCIYFSSWYKGEVVKEEPNKNYLDVRYLISKYYNAWKDLITSLFLGKTQGKDFQESLASFIFRLIGLIIPGLGSHSPRDYLNASRLAKITISDKEMV